jgi:regulator of protease activity HflC (stomatin/prohibitin superfamily)
MMRSTARHMMRPSRVRLGMVARDKALSVSRTVGAFGIAFVETSNTAIVERFGKFKKIAQPGLQLYIPIIEQVRQVSNRVEQATYNFEVKTKDNIFAELQVAVQVEVKSEDTVKALYTLSDPAQQIHAMLDAEIRAQASSRNLDDMFEQKEEISRSVFTSKTGNGKTLSEMIKDSGFTLHRVLIRGIEPAAKVKDAMNEINASLRLREARKHQADGEYIKAVREAEADRDRKRLQGEGISQQRLAIMKGYQDGIHDMATGFGLTPREVADFVVKTQHLDAVEAIGKSNNCKTLFLQHDPKSTNSTAAAVMMANEATSRE